MGKLLAAALIAIVVAVIVVASLSKDSQTVATQSAAVTASAPSQPPQAQIHMHEFAAKGRVPAYYETPPDIRSLPKTLSPDIFTGNQRLAYQVAQEIPQTLAQLPCYCHCDRGHGHKSLLSCFETEHGENCGICIGEALMAYNLEKRGVSANEIRQQIIAAYGKADSKH